MPRLTVKLSGAGRLVTSYVEVPAGATQAQLDEAAQAAAAVLTNKRASRPGDAALDGRQTAARDASGEE